MRMGIAYCEYAIKGSFININICIISNSFNNQ